MLKRLCIGLWVVSHLFACGNILDIEPETLVTYTNYFKGEEDAAALLYNIMGRVQPTFTGYDEQEVVGMKVDIINESSKYGNIMNWVPSYYLQRGRNWENHYRVIYDCNLLIDNVHRFEEIDKERLDFYVQEAYFFRAFAYFDLVRRWGDVPVIPNSTTTERYGKTDKMKVLEEEVIKVAESLNLPLYDELVGVGGAKLTSKQYGCKGTVVALLANAYAWKAGLTGDVADWEKAEHYCTELISGNAGNYPLAASPQELCDKVLQRGGDETIFEIEYYITDDIFFLYEFYAATSSMIGYPVNKTMLPSDQTALQVSRKLVEELYGDMENDRRVRAYFAFVEGNPVAFLKKWNFPVYVYDEFADKDVYKIQNINRIIWRMADIKLLRAECRARQGKANAAEDMNDIRERAYGDRSHDYTAAEGDIQMAIFRERERELLYEGHRFFDVMRNGYWKTELTQAFSLMTERDIKMGAQYYAVPDDAFYLNDLMVQNEYWQTKK
ncbi:MAG TPA: RagB/SusD family nutrient uptake outer membrane protein [Candidatus Butyricimonas faecavium]|nr:RagB/SusD family nutrient uptake outer membrane protein [Candidatus Butyricimonas faecavium]